MVSLGMYTEFGTVFRGEGGPEVCVRLELEEEEYVLCRLGAEIEMEGGNLGMPGEEVFLIGWEGADLFVAGRGKECLGAI